MLTEEQCIILNVSFILDLEKQIQEDHPEGWPWPWKNPPPMKPMAVVNRKRRRET
jgi:hypothetical protein